MLQSSNVGYDRLREAVLSPWVDPTTMASIGRNGKSKLGLAGSGIREYESNEGHWGFAAIGFGIPHFELSSASSHKTLGPLSIYGTRCFKWHTRLSFSACIFSIASLYPLHSTFLGSFRMVYLIERRGFTVGLLRSPGPVLDSRPRSVRSSEV